MKKGFMRILLAVAVFISFGVFCSAQSLGGDFSLSLVPKNPEPGKEVSATIKTFSFDPDRVEITWQIDGKTVAKGAGGKSIKFTAPDLGKERKIDAFVSLSNGAPLHKSFIYIGYDVDLLWEALTYSPSWYKGRTLAVMESSIKITANPYLYSNGKEILASNLIYEWFVNYSKNEGGSGAGKNFFTFNMNQYKDYVVSVRVSSFDNRVSFEKVITFPLDAVKPKIVFYEDNLLEGIRYNKALKDSIDLRGEEITLRAEPFFFSAGAAQKLSYKWTVNGKIADPDNFPNILSLRTEGGAGSASVGLKISNPTKIFQSAQKSLLINYGQ